MEKFILKSQRNITILDDKELKETTGGAGYLNFPPIMPDQRRRRGG